MVDFLASQLAPLAGGKDSPTTDGSGPRLHDALGRFGPDGAYSRTCPDFLALTKAATSESSSLFWPTAAFTTSNGALLTHSTSESPSVAVEFDTFFNNSNDPSIGSGGSNHVGISLGGNPDSVLTAPVATNMDDGAKWTVWVDYNGTALEVRMSTNGVRPNDAILTKSLNLSSQVNGDSAFLGFSAGTGGAHTNHDLLGWAYSDSYVPGGLAAVPEPGTYALLGLGGLLLFGARRFRRAR